VHAGKVLRELQVPKTRTVWMQSVECQLLGRMLQEGWRRHSGRRCQVKLLWLKEVKAQPPIDVSIGKEKYVFSIYFSMAITASELLSLNTFIV